MPVAKGPRFDVRSAAIVGGIAVVAALVIGFAAVQIGQRSGRLVLGDVDFRSLRTDNMAAEIAENGPILWPDVGGGTRDIWLQHVGDDLDRGWTAFDARASGEPRECNVRWQTDSLDFTNPCTGETFPANGDGLPPIPVFVEGAELIIDLNNLRDPAGNASS